MYTTLIQADELNRHLHDPGWVMIDCRFDLARPEAGRAAYVSAHIPGARYAHLDQDLSSPVTATTGRHPLPDPERLGATFGRWGIDRDMQVVAYDTDSGAMAARLWWLLRWLGHEAVAVLDGGLKAWQRQALPLSSEISVLSARTFQVSPQPDSVLDTPAVFERFRSGDWRLLDARASERFAGEVEPIDPVAGHVPGAVNHPFSLNLLPDGRFRPAAQLRTDLQDSMGGVPPRRVIAMCGSGVTACHNLLAMEIAGLPGAQLYAGSWSEWIRDRTHPVATGRNPSTP